MTGKEKIRATIQEIDEALQELITGNKVKVYSGGLPGTLEEQKQILDLLANDKKAIKYTQSYVYESEDEIDPYMKIHIMEENVGDGIGERMMTEELMRSQCYDIEVLDAFADILSETRSDHIEPPREKEIENNGYLHFQFAPSQYDKTKGVIHFDPFRNVVISKTGSAKTKDGKKVFECWILELVFKNVKTMKDGVTFSKILTLANHKITTTEIRKIRNAVDAINNKVTDAKGPEKLLKVQKGHVFLNNSYL